MTSSNRPTFVRHLDEIPEEVGAYPGHDERFSIGKALARAVGLTRIGIHLERLPKGARTSWPHAEEKEEEFVFVLSGTPDVWLDGELVRLRPGDIVGFPAGTGIAHTFLNDTDEECELLVVGERRDDNRIIYPLHPGGHGTLRPGQLWDDAPTRLVGDHDGLPRLERERQRAPGAGAGTHGSDARDGNTEPNERDES